MGNEHSYDYHSGYYDYDDGVNRRNWADISQAALRRENQAKESFAIIKKEWENKQDLEPGSRHVIPLLDPSHHLVQKVWVRFHRQVNALTSFNGTVACWDLKRREATREERDKFRITRKSKVFFIDAIYKVPKDSSSFKQSKIVQLTTTTTTTASVVAGTEENKKRSSLPTSTPSASAGSLPNKKPRLSNSTNIIVAAVAPLVTPGTMAKTTNVTVQHRP